MILAQATTQPVIHQVDWQGMGGFVTVVIVLLSGTLLTAIVNAILKIIDARTSSRLKIIEAELAAAKSTALIAKTQTEALTSQVKENRLVATNQLAGMQQQLTTVAMATPIPLPAVIPVKADDYLSGVPKKED